MLSPASDHLSLSESSRSASPFSELSTQDSVSSAQTDVDNADGASHLLVLSPPCQSPCEFESFLRDLPLQSRQKQYLIIGLVGNESKDSAAAIGIRSLKEYLQEFAVSLGKDKSFESWSVDSECGEGTHWLFMTRALLLTISKEAVEASYLKASYKSPSACSEQTLQSLFDAPSSTFSVSVIDDSSRNRLICRSQLNPNDALIAFASAGLHLIDNVSAARNSKGQERTLYLLERAPFSFPSLHPLSSSSKQYTNPYGPPTRDEWRRLWTAWDFVTLEMIPPNMLHQKPIDLRHKCLFYIGHIPT